MDIFSIGNRLCLNLQTRELSRATDGRKVTLSVSASLCLTKMKEAEGEVVSQESLIESGWRNIGLEVTASSVRVTINQLRRALLSLQVDKEVMIVTVPRMGYRLLLNEESEAIEHQEAASTLAADTAAAPEHSAPISPLSKAVTAPKKSTTTLIISLLLAAVLGSAMAWWATRFVGGAPTRIYYQPLTFTDVRQGIAANQQVFTETKRPVTTEQAANLITAWRRYTPEADSYRYLYINAIYKPEFMGLFACRKPLVDKNSDCKSFFFRFD